MDEAPGFSLVDPGAEVRDQLLERRARLTAVPDLGRRDDFRRLLHEVDSALARLDEGSFGTCEVCHESIERDRLHGDPLVRVCLGCLDERQRAALERDLELASAIQRALLPAPQTEFAGWRIEHRYLPHGPVSGDYCDVLRGGADEPVLIVLGDVSGKGVPASILMAHLQAVFRSLASLQLSLAELARRANHILCTGAVASAYSTLLLGRLWPDGMLELSNAGHCPPLLVRGGRATPIAATGLPLGLFCETEFEVVRHRLSPGDGLFLYTDGLSEAVDGAGEHYGLDRIETFALGHADAPLDRVLTEWLAEVDRFRGGRPPDDDLTVMLVRRERGDRIATA